jgi:hypothetical protein
VSVYKLVLHRSPTKWRAVRYETDDASFGVGHTVEIEGQAWRLTAAAEEWQGLVRVAAANAYVCERRRAPP